jgi:hypothetical protein
VIARSASTADAPCDDPPQPANASRRNDGKCFLIIDDIRSRSRRTACLPSSGRSAGTPWSK